MAARLKILVALQTNEHPFQRLQGEEARSAAQRQGVDVEVIYADSNPVLQIQQLLGHISAPKEKRPAAIILESVGADGLERMARTAVRAGITWVLLSARAPYIDLLRKEYPNVPISAVAVDNEDIGRVQGRQFRAILPRGGAMLYVEGPRTAGSVIGRRKAVEETLKDSGIEIVKKLSTDWTEAEAERVVSSWLKLRGTSSGSIDLVGAQNDSVAMGARKAILAYRPEWAKVPFTGVDGLKEEGALLVKQGVLAATIAKPPNAGKGVELAARALRGEPMPPSATLPVLSIPTIEELIRKYR